MKLFQPFNRAHGMDISDYMVRIAEVHADPAGLIIHGFNEIPLEEGVVSEGEIKKFDVLEKKVRELYKKSVGSFSSPFVIVAIPERKTYTKVVEMEKIPPEQINEAIRWEAEQHFPIALEDVYTTWSPVTESKDKLTLLLCATDKIYVEQYNTLLESVGKHVVIAEPESAAMQRFLLTNDPTPSIILDLGASKTSADIIVNNVIRYTSTISFSGNDLTQLLSQQLNLRKDQAERAKLLFGLDPVKSKGVVRKILKPKFSGLITHLNDILDYYNSQFQNLEPVKQIILCGGGSRMQGLAEYLEEELHIGAKIILPKINTLKKVGSKFNQDKELSFVTVFGLALRSDLELPFEMIN